MVIAVSVTALGTMRKADLPSLLDSWEEKGNYPYKVVLTNEVCKEGFLTAALLSPCFVNLGTTQPSYV